MFVITFENNNRRHFDGATVKIEGDWVMILDESGRTVTVIQSKIVLMIEDTNDRVRLAA